MCLYGEQKGQDMTYQKLFNETLSKMRLVTGAALPDNEPLMRSLVKVMYDFSDALKQNNLLKGQDNAKEIHTSDFSTDN